MEQLISTDVRELREIIRKAAQENIEPFVADSDRDAKCPQQVFDFFQSAGLYQLLEAAQNGDVKESFLRIVIAVEELSAICAGFSSLFTVHVLGFLPFVKFSDPAKRDPRQTTLRNYANGSRLFGYAPSGANSLSVPPRSGGFPKLRDHERLSWTANGRNYTLSGTIPQILLGKKASAVIVIAYKDTSNPDDPGTAFLVETEGEGVRFGEPPRSLGMGLRALPVCSLELEACSVPADNVIGDENHGKKVQEYTETMAYFLVSAQATGIIRNAFEHARQYSLKREQFGVKIGSFQAIEDMLINMQVSLNAGRSMLYSHLDDIHSNTEQAVVSSAQAKLYTTEAAMKAATDSVQIYGGYGYMRDFPVEKLMRDAKMLQVLFGFPHHIRRLLAKHL